MERELDGHFPLKGIIAPSTLGYWHSFNDVEIYPTHSEWMDGSVFGVSLSFVMIEWYEQVYKKGNSSASFKKDPYYEN